MTYLTYNFPRPMSAPKIPKLVYMSYCHLTIWLISKSLSANYFTVTIWQCDNLTIWQSPAGALQLPANKTPWQKRPRHAAAAAGFPAASCGRSVGCCWPVGCWPAACWLSGLRAFCMGGVGPATDRSRCRSVCSNFLFFYKKSMLIFHHVW